MRMAVLCVGKLRERYYQDAAAEYVKRLGRFGGAEIIEVADLPEPRRASDAEIRQVVDAEGEALLARVQARDYVVALCVDGRQKDSPGLAAWVREVEDGGAPRMVWVIGGSNGLSRKVLARAQARLSFSPMTFPHQLARVMLLEQLYRARKILAGEIYHK